MRPLFTLTILASLAIGSCSCKAADTAALAKRLHHAAELSSLDDAALKAWHLKLSVQLYDAKGNPSEQGTIEEWWTPEKDKRVYDTPSYKATEIRDGKAVYRTKGQPTVPFLLNEARDFVVHPVAVSEVIDHSDLNFQVQSFGKVQLDCILLTQRGSGSASDLAGRVPTYCLEPGVDQLRAFWLDPEVSARSSTARFQERQVGVSNSISIYGAKAISEHVEMLDSKAFDESVFTPGSDVDERSADAVWVSSGVAIIKRLKSVAPTYPVSAKYWHISGSVMLIVTIGTDGHIIDTEVVGSPDHSLSESAAEAVKQWVYTPYLVNGIAVKMRTTTTIHYKLAPR